MPIDITNQTRRVQYVGSGTGPYDFDFEVLAQTDIAVYQDDTLLVLTTDYSVTINSDGTGSVTTVASMTASTVTIIGARPYQRITDFSTGGDFRATTVNDEFDSLQIQILQLVEELGRAIKISGTSTYDGSVEMPAAAAGALIGWGADGESLTSYSLGDLADLSALTPTAFYTDPATGYMGLGRTDPGYWIDFNKTYTDVGPSEAEHFFHMYGTIDVSSLSSVGQITGFYGHLDGGASMVAGKTAAAIYPLRGNGTWGRAGTVTSMRGVYAGARVSSEQLSGTGDGVITNGYGAYLEAANETTGTGTITNAYASYNEVRNNDGGAMTLAYGLYSYVRNQTNGGGITTGEGVHCSMEDAGAGIGTYRGLRVDSTVAADANHFSMYLDSAAKTWINGSVAIGDSTASSAGKLHIQDAALTSAAIMRSNSATFTGDAIRVQAGRDASTAFDLITGEVNVSTSSNVVFRVRGDGEATCDGAFTGGGADYAEYFERADGGAEGDWTGKSVVIEGGKIRLAKPGEEPVGIVSARPTVVGDAEELHWRGKYVLDEFRRPVREAYTITEVERYVDTMDVLDTNALPAAKAQFDAQVAKAKRDAQKLSGRKRMAAIRAADDLRFTEPRKIKDVWERAWLPSDAVQSGEFTLNGTRYRSVDNPGIKSTEDAGNTLMRPKISLDYDSKRAYLPRSQRPEWAAVGLMGKLRVIKGQATGARWIKLRDVSETVEEWLVR